MVQPLGKGNWKFLTKLNLLFFPYDPAITFKGLENLCSHKNLNVGVYSIFVIAKILDVTKMSFRR
jgi:hypothetical protein